MYPCEEASMAYVFSGIPLMWGVKVVVYISVQSFFK